MIFLSVSDAWRCQQRAFGVFACLLVFLCPPGTVCGQSSSPDSQSLVDSDQSERWVPSFRMMGQDALAIVRAPMRLSRSEQFLALGATGVTFSVMAAVDRPLHRQLHVRSGPVSNVSRSLAAPGRWYDQVGPDRFALGTVGLLGASGLVLQRPHLTRTSVRLAEALVYTKIVTGFAKGLFGRSRPFVGAGPFAAEFGEFEGKHPATSMPSGHTARAFAVASVLAHQFQNPYVSVLAYSGAASVGLERVRSGDHWATDVAVGAALGYIIGQTVAGSRSPRNSVAYTPILSTDRVGISVQF